jgi:acyl-coenzyme A synthetase/AMP-(fatty) acid ligase
MAALKSIRDRYSDEQISAYYEAGYWTEDSFNALARAQAEMRPDKLYIFDSTTSLTYADFREKALRLAVGLKRSGVQRGERVAVQLPNWTEFPIIAAALSRIGAIIVPIMPIYRDGEVQYALQNSGAVAAITCVDFRGFGHLAMFEGVLSEAPSVKSLYVARPPADFASDSVQDLATLFVDGDVDELEVEAGPDSHPDDGFLIVYTSGTTNRPKGCFHTFNTIKASASGIKASLRYTEDDVQFGPSPITHSTGLVTSVVLPLLAGASSYLMEAWDPEQGIAAVERHKCTAAVTATPFLQMLMGAHDPAKHDVSSLRLWVCAGSPIPGSVVTAAQDQLGLRTLSLYGRSENMLTTMCTVDDAPERAATSDGSALLGAEIRCVDRDGVEVPRGEEGDISYRGPSHMIEYFQDDEQTAELFTRDGFSRSGDLGRMDEAGFVRVTGRIKDIIIRGGMNISAREVEEHLLTHPAVADVAAVGYPDERLGEKVCAYVILKEAVSSITIEEMSAHLREHKVALQKHPERVEIVAAFPMTATGKVQKHLLRAELKEKLGIS